MPSQKREARRISKSIELRKSKKVSVPVARGYVIQVNNVDEIDAYLTLNRLSTHDVKIWTG